jgi:F420 biosynthesis protein FbiB-like protein
MSWVTDAIKTRRSIRKYSTRQVTKATLDEILEAARWAPSAHNAQPWRFAVLTDSPTKKVLAEAMAKALVEDLIKNKVSAKLAEKLAKRSIERFTRAPVMVVACVTMMEMPKRADDDGQETERDLAIQSLGAAIQNLLLAAHSKGLGACWFCAPNFCKNVVREVLHFPQSFEPQALVTMGYPDEKPEAPERKPFQDIFSLGYWTLRKS